jgi:hypothetical protein
MWIIYYDDDDAQFILDIVSTYENLVNYFRVFQEQCPGLRQVGPIPNLTEEGKLVLVLQAHDIRVFIVRMLPRSTPSFNRDAFEFD